MGPIKYNSLLVDIDQFYIDLASKTLPDNWARRLMISNRSKELSRKLSKHLGRLSQANDISLATSTAPPSPIDPLRPLRRTPPPLSARKTAIALKISRILEKALAPI